jgi:hypothetical protein
VERAPVQKLALVVGAVFLLVGILGFIPGPTQNFDDLKFAGHTSDAELFGIFQVSVLHNVVHLLFGVAGLALARRVDGARLYLLGGGAIYVVIWLYGVLTTQSSGWNFVPFNNEDDYLHLFLGLGMVAASFARGRRPVRDPVTAAPRG